MSASYRGNDPERFWAVVLGDGGRAAPALGQPDFVHGSSGGHPVSVWWGDQADLLATAQDERGIALFQGRLHTWGSANPATSLLSGFRRRGEGVVSSLNGAFSAVVADSNSPRMLAVRDPLGVLPLFYSRRAGGLVISPSPDLLAYCGTESPTADRLALFEWLTLSTTPMDRTLYAGVARIPPGHALAARDGDARIFRYWEPSIGRLADSIDDAEALNRFDAALDCATTRLARNSRCAVFLSGGLDSSVAASALAKHHREAGLPAPLAVSLKFPDPDEDEEVRAAQVAQALGLPHRVIPLAEATGGPDLLDAAITASRRSWFPIVNPWNAAYEHLAGTLVRDGFSIAVRGEGGNDLLEPPWELGADLIRRLDPGELLRFVAAQPPCYGGDSTDYLLPILWQSGLAAIARPLCHRVLLEIAPTRARMLRAERMLASIPVWALPDSDLRAEVVAERLSRPPELSSHGLYAAARRKLLDNTYVPISLETAYLVSRRTGVEEPSPYRDPNLFSLVYALPPRSLYLGGHNKGLAHGSFARSVGAGLAARLGPSSAGATFAAVFASQGPAELAKLGGLPRLAALGIVSKDAARLPSGPSPAASGILGYQAWNLLAAEAWLQERSL